MYAVKLQNQVARGVHLTSFPYLPGLNKIFQQNQKDSMIEVISEGVYGIKRKISKNL